MRGVWKVSAVLTALVLVVSGVAMFGYSGTMWKNGIGEGGEKGVIPLMPPPFIQIAGASDIKGGNVLFPEDEVGISAYVNVGEDVIDTEDIKKLLESDLFEQPVENFSANHIIGIIPIPNYGGDVRPHVYVDTEGWIVAYFTKDEPVSLIMDWQSNNKGDVDNPKIKAINTTTLEQAIKKTIDELGLNYDEIKLKIKYYDFEFPDADKLFLFVKTRSDEGSDYVYIQIPESYKLYEASYYFYTHDSWYYPYSSYLKVDGKEITEIGYCEGTVRTIGQYDTEKVLNVGQSHTIEICYNCHVGPETGSAGVATVLIYKID